MAFPARCVLPVFVNPGYKFQVPSIRNHWLGKHFCVVLIRFLNVVKPHSSNYLFNTNSFYKHICWALGATRWARCSSPKSKGGWRLKRKGQCLLWALQESPTSQSGFTAPSSRGGTSFPPLCSHTGLFFHFWELSSLPPTLGSAEIPVPFALKALGQFSSSSFSSQLLPCCPNNLFLTAHPVKSPSETLYYLRPHYICSFTCTLVIIQYLTVCSQVPALLERHGLTGFVRCQCLAHNRPSRGEKPTNQVRTQATWASVEGQDGLSLGFSWVTLRPGLLAPILALLTLWSVEVVCSKSPRDCKLPDIRNAIIFYCCGPSIQLYCYLARDPHENHFATISHCQY